MILLISGKAEHGKTTFAQRFIEKCPDSIIINFADLVKIIAQKYYGWNGQKDSEGRSLLQKIGTQLRLARDTSIWAQITARLIKFLSYDVSYVLVPDTRFKAQYESVVRACGKENVRTIRVRRVNSDGSQFQNHLTQEQRNHASETDLDFFEFDDIIENRTGSYEEIDRLIERILKNESV